MEFLAGRLVAPVEGTRKLLDLVVQIADGMPPPTPPASSIAI